MSRRPLSFVVVLLIAITAAAQMQKLPVERVRAPRFVASFEANVGQFSPEVQFLARTPERAVMLTREGLRFRSGEAAEVSLAWEAAPQTTIEAEERVEAQSNYFFGQDRRRWHREVPHFARVRYREVQPGVDLVVYGKDASLEYDVVVRPGGDPSSLKLRVAGATLKPGTAGELRLVTEAGEIVQKAPVVYQEKDGKRTAVRAAYRLLSQTEFSFALGPHDPRQTLVIDPVLEFSTAFPFTQWSTQVTADAQGNIYLAGAACGLPTTGGALQESHAKCSAFVTKMSPAGDRLLYSTYLGGVDPNNAVAIAVDRNGNAYVAGNTTSKAFPATEGAFQRTLQGEVSAFVAKLNPTGSQLVYATYVGGAGGRSWAEDLAVTSSGEAIVTGSTNTDAFPVTPNSRPVYRECQANNGHTYCEFDTFVTKLNASGTALVYSMAVGGRLSEQRQRVAADAAGNAYATMETRSADFPTTEGAMQRELRGRTDVAVVKLDPTGATLYATYYGGNELDTSGWCTSESDYPDAIAVDPEGAVYVAGATTSEDLPVTADSFQPTMVGGFEGHTCLYDQEGFVAKIAPDGGSLVYGAFSGAGGVDEFTGLAVDAQGRAVLAGYATGGHPMEHGGWQRINNPAGCYYGCPDALVLVVSPDGRKLDFASLLGGSSSDGAFDVSWAPDGTLLMAGGTWASDFPYTPNGFDRDPKFGWLVKINLEPHLAIRAEAARPQIALGEETTVTLTASNPGPALDNVTLTIPATGFEVQAVTSDSATCAIEGFTAKCPLGAMASGDAHSFQVSVKARECGYAGLRPSAQVSFGGRTMYVPPYPEYVSVGPRSWIEVRSVPGEGAILGKPHTYSVDLLNHGKYPTEGLTAKLNVPETAKLVALHSSRGTCNVASASCTIGEIAPQGSERVTATVEFLEPGNQIHVLSWANGAEDCSWSVEGEHRVHVPVYSNSELSVRVLSEPKSPGALGVRGEWRIEVKNSGPDPANVTADLKEAAYYGTWAVSNSEPYSNVVRFGVIPPGATREVVVGVSDGPIGTEMAATFRIWALANEANTSDNELTLKYQLYSEADLGVTATLEEAEAEQVRIAVTVTNPGPTHAQAVWLNVALPAGEELISSDWWKPCMVGATIRCDIGRLWYGNPRVLRFVTTKRNAQAYKVQLTVESEAREVNAANNSFALDMAPYLEHQVVAPAEASMSPGSTLIAEVHLAFGLAVPPDTPVTLACEAPAALRCSLNPAQTTPAAPDVKLTITAGTATAARRSGTLAWLAMLALPAGFIFAADGIRRRTWLLLLAIALMAAAVSCGGGKAAENTTTVSAPKVYDVVVKATMNGNVKSSTIRVRVR